MLCKKPVFKIPLIPESIGCPVHVYNLYSLQVRYLRLVLADLSQVNMLWPDRRLWCIIKLLFISVSFNESFLEPDKAA